MTLLALLLVGDGRGVVENDLADGRAGGGAEALGKAEMGAPLCVEVREDQLAQLLAADAPEGLIERDQALVDKLGRDAEGRRGGALADAGLQHPQLAALDRELDVAQVAVVGLQRRMAARSSAYDVGSSCSRLVSARCCGCRRRRPRPGHSR
jgi:hypothetical protein